MVRNGRPPPDSSHALVTLSQLGYNVSSSLKPATGSITSRLTIYKNSAPQTLLTPRAERISLLIHSSTDRNLFRNIFVNDSERNILGFWTVGRTNQDI